MLASPSESHYDISSRIIFIYITIRSHFGSSKAQAVMTDTESEPSERILALAKPSHCCDKRELESLKWLCEASKEWLKRRALELVNDNAEEPLLIHSSSDGTPITTRTMNKYIWDNLEVKRNARETNEFLVQRVFVMATDFKPRCVFEDPTNMQDKTVSTHMRAGMDLFPFPREQGHTGLLVDHKVYDRAVMSGLAKQWGRYYKAYYVWLAQNTNQNVAYKRWLWHWWSIEGCFGHDCHNGLKWGVFDLLKDKETVRDAYISVESLRNGFDALTKNLEDFVKLNLVYEDSSMAHWHELWISLGLSGDWLDIAVELQLRFEDGSLKVAVRCESKLGLVNQITTFIMHLFKFSKFTDSRFITLGCTGRAVVASLIVGLRALVDKCIKDPRTSSYYISGFKRLGPDVARLYATVAMSSFVADSALHLIFDDGRLPRILPEVDNTIVMEFRYVCEMPYGVWTTIANSCGLGVDDLVSGAIFSALIQAGYIYYKTLPARASPYSLNRGDPLANLRALAEEPAEPKIQTTSKMWTLMQKGVPAEDLLPGLAFLDECDWTGIPVEQGHVQASRLMQKHPFYTQDTMRARAQTGSMQALLRRAPEEAKCAALQKRIDQLERYQAHKFGARQLYVKQLNTTVDHLVEKGRDLSNDVRVKVMQKHGQRWHELSESRRADLEAAVPQARQARIDDNDAELASLYEKLAGTQKTMSEGAVDKEKMGLRVSSCRLDDAALADFNAFCKDNKWTSEHVQALREKALQPTGHVEDDVQRGMDAMADVSEAKVRWRPPWMSFVARHRAELRGSVFKLVAHGKSPQYFAFVYATQTPLLGCFAIVRRLEVAQPVLSAASWEQEASDVYDYQFAYDEPKFVYTEDRESWAYDYILVLTDGVARQGGLLCSDSEFLQLDVLIAMWDRGEKPDLPANTADEEGTAPPKIWTDDPWMINFWDHPVFESDAASKGKPSSGKPHGHGDGDHNDEFDEIFDVEALVAELYRRRLEMEGHVPDGEAVTHFSWQLRGGAWTAAHHGVAFDSVRAFTCTTIANKMMKHYHLAMTGTFAVAKYTDELARELAKCWIDKHAFMLEQWVSAGEDPNFDLAGTLHAFVETRHFGSILASGHVHAMSRLQQIRGILPVL